MQCKQHSSTRGDVRDGSKPSTSVRDCLWWEDKQRRGDKQQDDWWFLESSFTRHPASPLLKQPDDGGSTLLNMSESEHEILWKCVSAPLRLKIVLHANDQCGGAHLPPPTAAHQSVEEVWPQG